MHPNEVLDTLDGYIKLECSNDYNSTSNKSYTTSTSNITYDPSTITIGTGSTGYTYNNWIDNNINYVTNTYISKDELEDQLDILDSYFKPNLIKINNYDRELTETEFFDLMKIYIKDTTKRDCNISFTRNLLKETFTFKFDNDTMFSLSNDYQLTPEIYLSYKGTFYVNTAELLAVIKKAAFNRLLNV